MKKVLIILSALFLCLKLHSQNIQLLYDMRHTAAPALNNSNFPAVSFEYFKNVDTSGNGSFLMKSDIYFNGIHNNPGQVFTQISQTIKFWKPNVFISSTYSGGLGVTSSGYGFNIANSFGLGAACLVQLNGLIMSASLCYRVTVFDKRSYDPQVILYLGKGFLNYRIFMAGSFTFFTANRNQGDVLTSNLKGKKISFYGDPQFWIRVKSGLSAGSKFMVYYHLLSDDNHIQVYPSFGMKYQF